MTRMVTVGAAQSGPIARSESRSDAVNRLLVQLRKAHRHGCDLVVFTECALTPFFPHWWIEDEARLNSWFETEMPGPSTQLLFDEARRLGIGFCLGFAELTVENGVKRRFNSSMLVERNGHIVGKFRKIHLPGHTEHRPHNPFQNLEKRYFEVGDLGFPAWKAFGGGVGMCICNDRRWPETWRSLALAGAELIVLGLQHAGQHSRVPGIEPSGCVSPRALSSVRGVPEQLLDRGRRESRSRRRSQPDWSHIDRFANRADRRSDILVARRADRLLLRPRSLRSLPE